jgi:hypothetical protein
MWPTNDFKIRLKMLEAVAKVRLLQQTQEALVGDFILG